MKEKGDGRCLNLFMLAHSHPADLDRLATIDAACPVPEKRAGSCLLSVAQDIVKATGRTKLKLSDGSKVRCVLNRERVSLWHLRVYQEKPTWYESHGFQVLEKTERHAQSIKAAQTYLLADLQANLRSGKEIPATGREPALSLLLQLTPEFEESKRPATVAQFMSWLWEKDCSAFATIDDLITRPGVGIEYAEIFPKFATLQKDLK